MDLDKLSFFEELNRAFRRYILLRISNPLFLPAMWAVWQTYIKGVTGYSIGDALDYSSVWTSLNHLDVWLGLGVATAHGIISYNSKGFGDQLTLEEIQNLTDDKLAALEYRKYFVRERNRKTRNLSMKNMELAINNMTIESDSKPDQGKEAKHEITNNNKGDKKMGESGSNTST